MPSNPVKADTQGAIESVRMNGIGGLNLVGYE